MLELGVHLIEIEGDEVDVRERDPGVVEAASNRPPRQAVRVLQPIEALLLDGVDELGVLEQRRGGIVPVPILAAIGEFEEIAPVESQGPMAMEASRRRGGESS